MSRLGGPTKKEFERVFEQGKRVSVSFGRLLAAPGSGKVGFATNKNIGCNARRNRVKRRAKEAFRLAVTSPSDKLNFVFSTGTAGRQTPFPQMVSEIVAGYNQVLERWESEWESC